MDRTKQELGKNLVQNNILISFSLLSVVILVAVYYIIAI